MLSHALETPQYGCIAVPLSELDRKLIAGAWGVSLVPGTTSWTVTWD